MSLLFRTILLFIFFIPSIFAAKLIDMRYANPKVLTQTHVSNHRYYAAASYQQTLNDSLKKIKQYKKDYYRHTRYQQLHHNIPIWGKQIIKHENTSGLLHIPPPTFNGILVKGIDKDTHSAKTPAFDSETALNLAKQRFLSTHPNQQWHFNNVHSQLYYYINSDKKAHLAYVINFVVDSIPNGHPARPFYIIDAINQQFLKQWNGLFYERIGTGPGGNTKMGYYEYGREYPFLNVTRHAKKCELSNEHVKTIDMKHHWDTYDQYGDPIYNPKKQKAVKFKCNRREGDDAINGAYSPINDAHYFGSVVFDMYQDWYHTTPLNTKIYMRVHYGTNFGNAFYDGESMTFGDGDDRFYPLVSLDVVAHEISHGFTDQHAHLIYDGQGGGLHEAFSDMAAKAVEYYVKGHNRWDLGSDIMKGNHALRYFDRPSKDLVSINKLNHYHSSLDVHQSCGVFNHAFYLLATSPGWDTHKAFDVMVYANQHYWTPDADFQRAAWGVVKATEELGYSSDAVYAAFRKVGIVFPRDIRNT